MAKCADCPPLFFAKRVLRIAPGFESTAEAPLPNQSMDLRAPRRKRREMRSRGRFQRESGHLWPQNASAVRSTPGSDAISTANSKPVSPISSLAKPSRRKGFAPHSTVRSQSPIRLDSRKPQTLPTRAYSPSERMRPDLPAISSSTRRSSGSPADAGDPFASWRFTSPSKPVVFRENKRFARRPTIETRISRRR